MLETKKKACNIQELNPFLTNCQVRQQRGTVKTIDTLIKSEVNGILVQLPLPKHIDENKVIEAIDPVMLMVSIL